MWLLGQYMLGSFNQNNHNAAAQIIRMITDEENNIIFTGDSSGIVKVWLYEEYSHNISSCRFEILHVMLIQSQVCLLPLS